MKSIGSTFYALLGGALLLPPVSQGQQRSFITPDASAYFKFETGPTFAQDGEITKFSGFPAGNKIDYDVGFDFGMAVGYAFNKYLAVEGEFGWNGNTINSVQGISQTDTFVYNVPFVANVVLQYPIKGTRVVPYVGGGAGGSVSIFDTEVFSNGATSLFGSDSDFVFAYQGFAGVRFEINPTMTVGLGYKYFATGDSDFTYQSPYGPDLHLGISGARNHMVMFSFNMKF